MNPSHCIYLFLAKPAWILLKGNAWFKGLFLMAVPVRLMECGLLRLQAWGFEKVQCQKKKEPVHTFKNTGFGPLFLQTGKEIPSNQ
jgi:hypothetical protein